MQIIEPIKFSPLHWAFYYLSEKFHSSGSLVDALCSSQRKTVLMENNKMIVCLAVTRSPKSSPRRLLRNRVSQEHPFRELYTTICLKV